MTQQSVELRELTISVLMTPDMANLSGNVHGGVLLKLLDEVAYACASRYAGCNVVTVSVDQVLFKQTIHVGEMVTLYASVNHVGRTSMEVGIKVVAENIQERSARTTISCYFTMVAYDKGKTVAVPPRPTSHLSKYALSWQGEFRASLRTNTGQSRSYEGRMG